MIAGRDWMRPVALVAIGVGAPAVFAQSAAPTQIEARELPLADAIRLAFASENTTVVISSKIRGTISGRLTGRPADILGRLQRDYGLLTFSDRSTVYVYAASEHTSATLMLGDGLIASFKSVAAQLDLTSGGSNVLRTTSSGVIFASGAPKFVQRITELQRAIASNPPVRVRSGANRDRLEVVPRTYRLYRLSYAWAEDVRIGADGGETVIPGVATILRALVIGTKGSPKPGTIIPKATGAQRVPPFRERSQSPLNYPSMRDGNIGLSGSAEPEPAPSSEPDRAPGTATDVSPRIEADPRQNAIIVFDEERRMPLYDALIAKLDVESRMIEIEATIIDIDSRKIDDLGLSWRLGVGGVSVGFGQPGSNSSSGTGLNLTALVRDGSGLDARLTALSDQGMARIVSRPQVLTMSNIEAVLSSRRTFFVRVSGERTADLFSIDVGTVMRVTPHIVQDGGQQLVRLLVNIEDGAPATGNVDQIPAINRTRIDANVLLNANESILLGGLTIETDSSGTEKAPFLGDIPVVGLLFKRQRTEKRKTERLFLISPRIAPLAADRKKATS